MHAGEGNRAQHRSVDIALCGYAGLLAPDHCQHRLGLVFNGNKKCVRHTAIRHERNGAVENGGSGIVPEPRTSAATAPARPLGRRQDQVPPLQQAREERGSACAGCSLRQGPCSRRCLQQRDHDQLPASLLERKRKIEGTETLAAMPLGDDGCEPFRLECSTPCDGVDLRARSAQRPQPLGPAMVGREARRSLGEQALLLGQQQVHGKSSHIRFCQFIPKGEGAD